MSCRGATATATATAAAAGGGSGKQGRRRNNVSWLWRGPRRALCAARDFYVRSLTGCAGHLPGDAAFGYPTFAAAAPFAYYSPATSSAASSRRASAADADEDLRELIRAASQRHTAAADRQRRQEQERQGRQRHPAAVSRSHSVAAMARIDEDGPCDFDASSAAAVFPRSMSCAPGHGQRGQRVAAGRRGMVAALAA